MDALPDLVMLLARAPRWVHLVFSFLASLWAFATALTLALRRVPEPAFARLEAASPRLGHFLRAWRKFGTDVLPFFGELAKAFARSSPPLQVVALALALGAGGALAGCPGLPPPDGCTPRAMRCSPAGVPQVCSGTQRWTNAAEQPCAAQSPGAVCCETPSAFPGRPNVYACAPAAQCAAADGGTQ